MHDKERPFSKGSTSPLQLPKGSLVVVRSKLEPKFSEPGCCPQDHYMYSVGIGYVNTLNAPPGTTGQIPQALVDRSAQASFLIRFRRNECA